MIQNLQVKIRLPPERGLVTYKLSLVGMLWDTPSELDALHSLRVEGDAPQLSDKKIKFLSTETPS